MDINFHNQFDVDKKIEQNPLLKDKSHPKQKSRYNHNNLKQSKIEHQFQLVMTTIGIFLITSMCSVPSIWAQIYPYIESYIRQNHEQFHSMWIQLGIYSIFLTYPISSFTFQYILEKLSFKWSIRIAMLGMVIGFICWLFMSNLVYYYIGWIMIGLSYNYTITFFSFLCMAIFENKALGVTLSRLGFSFSGFIYGNLSATFINPGNKYTTFIIHEGKKTKKIFDTSVTKNLPKFLNVVIMLWIFMIFILPEAIADPDYEENWFENDEPPKNLRDSIDDWVKEPLETIKSGNIPKRIITKMGSAQDLEGLPQVNISKKEGHPKKISMKPSSFSDLQSFKQEISTKKLYVGLINEFYDDKFKQRFIEEKVKRIRISKDFILIFFSLVWLEASCYYFIINFKFFTLLNHSDQVATRFAGYVIIFELCCKLIIGPSIDIIGWKIIYLVILTVLGIASICVEYSLKSVPYFYACYFCFYGCFGMSYILFFTSTQHFYGKKLGTAVWGYMGLTYPLIPVVNFVIEWVNELYGRWATACFISSVSFVMFGVVLFGLTKTKHIEVFDKENKNANE